MTFGRNPHVIKAQTAEQKARDAKDEVARALAWREAARQWDRAAERETSNDKRRQEYESHAELARAQADGGDHDDTSENAPAVQPDRSLN
jgi:hypothetical protein